MSANPQYTPWSFPQGLFKAQQDCLADMAATVAAQNRKYLAQMAKSIRWDWAAALSLSTVKSSSHPQPAYFAWTWNEEQESHYDSLHLDRM